LAGRRPGRLLLHCPPLDELRPHLLQRLAVLAADGQQERAEGVLRVAVAGAEDRRHGAAAGLAALLGEALQRHVNGLLQAAGDLAHRVGDGPPDGVGERVAGDGLGAAGGDEERAVGVGDVDPGAGLLAEVVGEQFNEHERLPSGRCAEDSRGWVTGGRGGTPKLSGGGAVATLNSEKRVTPRRPLQRLVRPSTPSSGVASSRPPVCPHRLLCLGW
jgi:hypothetical protein